MQHIYTPCPMDQLRKLVIQREYNRKELSKRTGTDPALLTRFINGQSNSPTVFSALCRHLNIALSTTHAPRVIEGRKRGRPKKEPYDNKTTA